MTETATPASKPPSNDWPWGFAFAVGAFVFGVGMFIQVSAWQGHWFRASLLHVSLVASLLALAAQPAVDGAALGLLGARGPVLAWRSFHFGALALAMCHAYTVGYFMRSSWSFFDWFGRLWELEPEYGLVPAATFLAAVVLVRVKVATRRRLRLEAWASTALAVALLACAAVRASRRPEVHHYISSLPEVGVLDAVSAESRPPVAGADEVSSGRHDTTIDDLTVRRYVFQTRGQCTVMLSRSAQPLPDTVRYVDARRVACERQSVRVDRAHGLLVFRSANAWSDMNHPFDLSTLEPLRDHDGAMVRFRDVFTLPLAWLWGSLGALAFALVALLAPQRARKRLDAWKSWRQGTLRDDETIVFEDGAVVSCPYGAALKPGPVVLLDPLRTSTTGAPFREATSAPTPERDALHAGSIAEVIASFEAQVDARYAYATAAAMMSMAPWPAAMLQGLIP